MEKPDRRKWLASVEQSWDALLKEYHNQFPTHPRAGEWLAENPKEGVHVEFIDGIGNVLVGWPINESLPDLDFWFKNKEKNIDSKIKDDEKIKKSIDMLASGKANDETKSFIILSLCKKVF